MNQYKFIGNDIVLPPRYKTRSRVLQGCNTAAFILHILSFTAALILAIKFSSTSLKTELTTDFRTWDGFNFVTTLKSLGTYQLIWLELPFPLITALFHGIIAFFPHVRSRYTYNAIMNESNWLRWLEYSITASFMTWVILQLSGVTNVITLVIVGIICNIALQYQGSLMEQMNTPQRIKLRKGQVNWTPTVIGWFIFIGQWMVIITYFLSSVLSSAGDVPAFVYAIVFGLFFQFSLFGLIQWLHYLRFPKFLASGYGIEIAYVTLSFVSKFFLDWTLLLGIILN